MQQVKFKIYLAGGLKSNWQARVIEACGNKFCFFNPREHQLEMDSRQYTTWDIFHIKQCDILLGYMEKENPSGYGLAMEIGYAKGLNKTVILVNEKSTVDENFARYFKIVEHMSDVVFSDFAEALTHLIKYI